MNKKVFDIIGNHMFLPLMTIIIFILIYQMGSELVFPIIMFCVVFFLPFFFLYKRYGRNNTISIVYNNLFFSFILGFPSSLMVFQHAEGKRDIEFKLYAIFSLSSVLIFVCSAFSGSIIAYLSNIKDIVYPDIGAKEKTKFIITFYFILLMFDSIYLIFFS